MPLLPADTELIIGVCDYGPAVAGRSSDQMLLGAKNSTLSNSASHLLSEKKITLGTNPGLQFEAENSATHFTCADVHGCDHPLRGARNLPSQPSV